MSVDNTSEKRPWGFLIGMGIIVGALIWYCVSQDVNTGSDVKAKVPQEQVSNITEYTETVINTGTLDEARLSEMGFAKIRDGSADGVWRFDRNQNGQDYLVVVDLSKGARLEIDTGPVAGVLPNGSFLFSGQNLGEFDEKGIAQFSGTFRAGKYAYPLKDINSNGSVVHSLGIPEEVEGNSRGDINNRMEQTALVIHNGWAEIVSVNGNLDYLLSSTEGEFIVGLSENGAKEGKAHRDRIFACTNGEQVFILFKQSVTIPKAIQTLHKIVGDSNSMVVMLAGGGEALFLWDGRPMVPCVPGSSGGCDPEHLPSSILVVNPSGY